MAIANNFFNGRPTFLNDFANGQTLDNRITFLRSGAATYYDGKSSALAEQNILLQSNNFYTTWGLTNTSVSQNVSDPSGTSNNAWTLTCGTTSSAIKNIYQTQGLGIATYTISAYLQAGTINFATLTSTNSLGNSSYAAVTVNLTSGSVAIGTPVAFGSYSSPSATITQVGSTSWYRITLSFTTTAGVYAYNYIGQSNSATPSLNTNGQPNAYVGATTDTILVYGAQLEQRSTATAYNQTTTTAINNFIPTLQSAPVNTPRFDFNPVTGESLGLLVEGSSTNLCTYSNGIGGTGWTNSAIAYTASANIAPDGTQTASLLAPSATSAQHVTYGTAINTSSSTVYTLSCYVKSAGLRYICLAFTRSSGDVLHALSNFDLQTGTAGTAITSGNVTYTTSASSNIVAVGNGWYRCALTFAVAAGGYPANPFIIATNTLTASTTFPTISGDGINGYYVWGMQFEATQNSGASSALTSFIATTSASVTRAAEYPTVTATNFSTFFNNSQGTWYVEAQGGYYASTGYCDAFVLGNASSSSVMRLIAQLNATQAQAAGPGGSISLTTNSLVNGVGQPNKIAFTYSNSSLTGSALGVATVSSSTNNAVPTATQMVIGYNISSQGWLNGHIKKLAYYPTAMTGANLQALTGS